MKEAIIDKPGKNILWGYAIAFIFLVTTYFLSFYTTSKLANQSNLVDHTNKVIDKLNTTYSTLKDDEA